MRSNRLRACRRCRVMSRRAACLCAGATRSSMSWRGGSSPDPEGRPFCQTKRSGSSVLENGIANDAMSDPPRAPGDPERVAGLFDRFAPALHRYAVMILADPAAAADVVQQVFVAMLRANPGVCQADHAYLRRAVRNECYSLLRRRRREPLVVVDAPLLEAIEAPDDRTADRLVIEQALRELPPLQREVVHLKVFEGLTFREIADLSGESINTVASRYRYAAERLRARLGARE
jgi:RNA polymerase sigma-70 factor (ECF subfamily)